jgi:hypothetical protein
MRILVVAVALMVPGLAHGQATATIHARAQVVDSRPSRIALTAVDSRRMGSTAGWSADAGLAVLAERTVSAQSVNRPRRGALVEINFLRN